ncbi:MAG: hypothetical protein COZ46_00780 [Verrucomicrobia bacterium CG_4_10_14_3_um_filter_43_23]|nr:MAG: hypothetical protein AUJ82_04200 [Verrucomicrobia bacterium CG1_02_43_26]PIP59428.1 MAG: hypothetical protein COX01_03720 [Verrucomicrobia bacterium CG22_combo_CG10-13_8_21_14_all_43_17]PIX59045.1 MAG: hypothetical protein COZ46_00780 [Verrucomicrobia bacterium CG_4_10_14_3_um_filter_43_23]PIY62578.1 MAG: hypothetical protein COY94_01620 [Verrucomicrobia bacterium CG_4_10_14_0_8_um_filter_43_34]PJA43931.1 MAG: hypothetical protein CO175_05555 [Verrucomicrobia bacterium CG_4_9_14_3_um_fi
MLHSVEWPEDLKEFEDLSGHSFHFLEAYFKNRDKYAKDDKMLLKYYISMTLARKNGTSMLDLKVEELKI